MSDFNYEKWLDDRSERLSSSRLETIARRITDLQPTSGAHAKQMLIAWLDGEPGCEADRRRLICDELKAAFEKEIDKLEDNLTFARQQMRKLS